MTLDEYMMEAIKTIQPNVDEVYLAGKLVAEATELFQPALKTAYHGKTPLTNEEFDEELGDALWYLLALATYRQRNIYDIMEANIAKLRARHGHSYNAKHYACHQ